MPDDLVPANEGNPHGHWEPGDMVALNDRILSDAGSDLYSAIDLDPVFFSSPRASAFVEEASEICARWLTGGSLLVLKDPRLSLTMPIWLQALKRSGCGVVHLVALRHPRDVATSLRDRHLKTIPYDAWPSPRPELVWLRYTMAAAAFSDGQPRCFVRYDELLRDWQAEVGRIARELELEWPRQYSEAAPEITEFLHANARSRSEPSPTSPPSLALDNLSFRQISETVYNSLLAAEHDGIDIKRLRSDVFRRISESQELISIFEDLYPVLWRYYVDATTGEQRLDLSLQGEQKLREAVRQFWDGMTHTNNEKTVLQNTLRSTQEHLEQMLGAVGDRENLINDLRENSASQVDRLTRVEEELTATRADRDRLVAEVGSLASVNREQTAQIESIRVSTSWRITGPLRVIARRFRTKA